jgi:hypothetical protein
MLKMPHQPRDKLFVHRFPRDTPPGAEVSVEIGGVEKELWDTAGPGSRPPKRHSNQKRQERFTLVEMEFGQKVIAHELQVNFTTAEVFLIGQVYSALVLAPQILIPRRSTLTTYYARKGKKKVLHAYFQGAGHPFINIDRVLEGYDRVYCVDTNTAINRSGQKVAVTTALAVKSKRLGEIAVHIGSDYTIQVVAHEPPSGNPELHGIWSVLGFLVRDHPELVEGRLAIITDTEFGMVKAWHERTEAFYNGHKLPDGVDIFYATADAGSEEFMPNRLMRVCDSLSAQKLREVIAS